MIAERTARSHEYSQIISRLYFRNIGSDWLVSTIAKVRSATVAAACPILSSGNLLGDVSDPRIDLRFDPDRTFRS